MAIKFPSILTTDRPIVDEVGYLTLQSREYFTEVTAQKLIIGDGSPEGIVEALEGATYQDRAGSAGAIRYAKQFNDILGDKSKGWILI